MLCTIHFLISKSFLFWLSSTSLYVTRLHESSLWVRLPPIECLAIFVIIYQGNKILYTSFLWCICKWQKDKEYLRNWTQDYAMFFPSTYLAGEKLKINIGEFKKQCHPNKHIFKYFFLPLENQEGGKINIQKKVKYLWQKSSVSNKRAVCLKQNRYSSG